MASIKWEPNVSKIVYGERIEESIFSARAIYQDADGDDYSPDGTYTYTYSGGDLKAGIKLNAGTYTLTVTFDPTDASLGGNIAGTASLTVEKATPVVTWNNPSDITYALYDKGTVGTVGPNVSDEQLNAKADVAGTFTYTPAKDTELNAGEQTVTATFVPTDTTNYKSLPQDGVQLKIQFEVLKGEIQVVWPIFENGACQEIRRKGRDPEIIPYELNYKAEDGTGEGLARPKFLSIFKEDPVGTFEAEVPGSITFDPAEGSELCEPEDLIEEKFITAKFTPSNPNNWKALDDSNEFVAKHQFAIYKRISGPDIAPTMFGCWVQSISASVGWGGTSSTCSLRLVEDPKNDFVWTPPLDSEDDILVGAACYFRYKGFYFGGVLTRWTYGESTSGRYYDIILESPAKLLDGVQVIMDSFEGTEYNFGIIPEKRKDKIPKDNPNTNENYKETGRYNRFRPSSQNPNLTTEVTNVYNALGHHENYSFGGIFGATDKNSVGFPANKLLRTIQLLSCPDEEVENPDGPGVDPNKDNLAFAHKCTFGEQEYFKIDLSEIDSIAPEFYRISGVSQSVNGIVSDVTELMQHDYFVTLEKDPNEGKLEAPALVMGPEGKAISTVILEKTGKTSGGLTEEELLDFWQEGDDGGGLITNPNIKIVAISKGEQPSPGIIRSLVNDFKQQEILMSSSIGQELQDDTTQKLIIGGPATRVVTRQLKDSWGIFAKRGDSSYAFGNPNGTYLTSPQVYKHHKTYENDVKTIPIFFDPFVDIAYAATSMELRMARGGRNCWQTYKVFESVYKGTYDEDPWCVDVDIDKNTLAVLAAGARGGLHAASTKAISSGKAFSKNFSEEFGASADAITDRIFQAVSNTANNFYGKMFALQMPTEPGGLDNNIRFILEDQKYEASWQAVDSGFDPGGLNGGTRFSDVSMFDPNGRTKTYVEWQYSGARDFSSLASNFSWYQGPKGETGKYWEDGFDAIRNIAPAGRGVASTSCSIENDATFFDDFSGETMANPFVIVNSGSQIEEYDSFTTPDFGLTVLAEYFFNITVPPEKYIGPGKAVTKIAIPPRVVAPRSFGIAQQSNRYSWGPWYGGDLKGKSEVIQDESLVPETFGTVSLMNQAGETLANVGNAAMKASETGYVEVAEFPSYNIAERFAGSGPYVSDMSISIDTSGFKTTYKFNTWTPQFGRLAKYNIDRIARINKASLELLQRERAKITRRPLMPPPSPPTAEDLISKQNRQDISLSLAQVFPSSSVTNPDTNEAKEFDGSWEVTDVSISDLGALSSEGGVYDKVAGIGKDGSVVPIHVAKDGSENENMPSFEAPEVQGEGSADGIMPNSKTQNPFFSTKVNEDDGTETFRRNTTTGLITDPAPSDDQDFAPDKMDDEQKKAVTAVRTIGTSLPRPAAGWGYDVAYNPVPNDGEDLQSFDDEFQKNPALRKAGPIAFLWDEERKHWAGGLEFLGGVLSKDITPAPSPTQPTPFKIKVFRKTSTDKGTGSLEHINEEEIDCYNRDTALQATASDNTWVIVIRLNYEWTPIWVSCI